MAHYLVSPDKYAFYTCNDLAKETQIKTAHEQELRQLMAKADVDAPGRLVSAVAYRPDYLTVRGEINELRAAAAAKKCDFVPGAAAPAARASDAAIH